MKTCSLIILMTLMLTGCISLHQDPYLWAIGHETKILENVNRQLDEIRTKYSGYDIIQPKDFFNNVEGNKAKLIEVALNGKKMRITFANESSSVLEQDEFDLSYSYKVLVIYRDEKKPPQIRGMSKGEELVILIKKSNFED